MYEHRCRLTPDPYPDGSWPILPDYFRLCNGNNCPENSYCGAPYERDVPWDQEEINNIEFVYGITGFDNIFQAFYTIL